MDAAESTILKVKKKLDSDSLDEEKVCEKSTKYSSNLMFTNIRSVQIHCWMMFWYKSSLDL